MNILDLPEACIANILSLTTPLDVCRSSAVSKIFNHAANSDSIWNHFFPTDPAGFAASAALFTRKQLYLVHHPQLLHDSQLSFWLDRRSGTKYCYMLAARALKIAWKMIKDTGSGPQFLIPGLEKWLSLSRYGGLISLVTST